MHRTLKSLSYGFEEPLREGVGRERKIEGREGKEREGKGGKKR